MLPYLASLHAEVVRRRDADGERELVVAHMGVGLQEGFVHCLQHLGGTCDHVTGNVWRVTFGGTRELQFTVVAGREMHSGDSIRQGAEACVPSLCLRACWCPPVSLTSTTTMLAHRLATAFQLALHGDADLPQCEEQRRAAARHAMATLGDKGAFKDRPARAERSAQRAAFSRTISVTERQRVVVGNKYGRRASGVIALDRVDCRDDELTVSGITWTGGACMVAHG